MSLALFLAAALNAAPAQPTCIPDLQAAERPGPCHQKPVLMAAAAPSAPLPAMERTPNLYRQPSRCGPIGDEITRRIEASAPRQRLAAQYAVIRNVDGCGVPTPVGYHPDYLMPVEPQALQTETLKPVDAPPRKR